MKTQSVVNLDPIDVSRKRESGFLGRLLKTNWYRGKPVLKTDAYGHYCFCGKQRSGKTVSMLWFLEFLIKKYKKQKKKIFVYSNLEIGNKLIKNTISDIIRSIDYDKNNVHILLIDEIQSYFPRETKDKATLALIDKLVADFSQLAKKQIYVLSTAQVYGRINKSVREQCLYMVYCRRSKITNKIVNDFIDGDDILCDDLGRWSGNPSFIKVHGLPKSNFNTHRMITE